MPPHFATAAVVEAVVFAMMYTHYDIAIAFPEVSSYIEKWEATF
jgi:uncharacterized protein Usg